LSAPREVVNATGRVGQQILCQFLTTPDNTRRQPANLVGFVRLGLLNRCFMRQEDFRTLRIYELTNAQTFQMFQTTPHAATYTGCLYINCIHTNANRPRLASRHHDMTGT
jgi:hypothetical protein